MLSRCLEPDLDAPDESNTGLVVGQVQSGKTLSFTALSAAAHDNNYRLIVVLAGTKNNLAEQSRDRLIRDLDATRPSRPWVMIHNLDTADRARIEGVLEGWGSSRGRRRTLLVTVLKHQSRIQRVADTLNKLPKELRRAALVIDDEADQASLNNLVRKGKESAVYKSILKLRSSLPRHSFIQYTATPQANIFIPLIDLLSPDFCEVLEPGEGYVGGRYVFKDHASVIVRTITDAEEFTTEIPRSLRGALRLFVLEVALGLIEHHKTSRLSPENRSMLVHPSRLVDDHMQYLFWIKRKLNSWKELLASRDDVDRDELLQSFATAYEDLAKGLSSQSLPGFTETAEWLGDAISETAVVAVNSASDWDGDWEQQYAWILVGGQKLERGFTVEGLTVTYMPRGKGVGLADTIQQRARFLGYKREYAEFCRVYLEPSVRDVFERYVESEDSMRNFLKRNRGVGALKSPGLKRQFQMDGALRPTRATILLDPPRHVILPSGWFAQNFPHEDLAITKENRAQIQSFLEENQLEPCAIEADTPWIGDAARVLPTHVHRVVDELSVGQMYKQLLSKLVMGNERDDRHWSVVLALLEDSLADSSDLASSLILMRPDTTTLRSTTRRGVRQLFMGSYPDAEGHVYKGDREVRLGKVCLQIHELQLYRSKIDRAEEPEWKDVTTLALWMDREFGKGFIVQG